MLDRKVCLDCLMFYVFNDIQRASYMDGELVIHSTDYEDVCEYCHKHGYIATYFGPASEVACDDEEYEEDCDGRGTELIDTLPSMGGADFRCTAYL